jgi:hypothetical protein
LSLRLGLHSRRLIKDDDGAVGHLHFDFGSAAVAHEDKLPDLMVDENVVEILLQVIAVG